jgi:hypothetical protein
MDRIIVATQTTIDPGYDREEREREHDALVLRVGERLRNECLEIFGSMWSYDVAWRLAEAAIQEVQRCR